MSSLPHATRPSLRRVLVASLLYGTLSCGGDSPTGIGPHQAASLTVVSGNTQSAVVGTELSAALVVRVTDAASEPVQGQLVNFRVTSGSGSVFAGAGISNADGLVQERWTLGLSTAQAQRVEARAVDAATGAPIVFATFEATPLPAAASALALSVGNAQSATVGTAVATRPAVKVTDAHGNPVPGVTVTFAVASGGGSVTGATPVTDAGGIAVVGGWTLGNAAGTNTLTATAAGLAGSPLTFSATGTAGAAVAVAIDAGNNQSALAGNPVGVKPSVKVTDSNGNPVAGVAVTFAVASGGGTVAAPAAATGTDGIATVGEWYMGAAAGANTLTATAPGLTGNPLTFTATGTVGPAHHPILITSAAGAASGAPFATQPVVAITDAHGNTVTSNSGTVVSITVSAPATIVGTATATTSGGVASFTNVGISGTAGTSYTLTLNAPGLGNATQSITPTPGAISTVTVTPGGVWTVPSTTAQLGAVARDARGNIVSDAPMTWTSSNSAVATVSEAGIVTGVAPGVATITATTGSVAGTGSTTTGRPFVAITGGELHDCGLTAAGTAYCWGSGSSGQLGNGTISRVDPMLVVGGLTFQSIMAGSRQTCGLTTTGAPYCWGSSSGNWTPVAVPGGFTFTSLLTHGSATAGLACGITGPGAAYCWGENQYGQLGDGTTTPTTSPVPVLGGLSFTALSSGGRHTCGLTTAGAAYCWGRDSLGQLGDGAPTAYRATPTAVQGGLTFKALAVGYDHTCGLTVAGQMYCWGGNADGQLGDGTTTDRSSPTPVAGGRTFTTVTAANAHSCGITDTGTTFCWGSNAEGELGDGTHISRSAPVVVQGGYVFVDITGGSRSTCGLTTAGQTYCWGLLLVPARNVLFLPFSSPQLVHQPYP